MLRDSTQAPTIWLITITISRIQNISEFLFVMVRQKFSLSTHPIRQSPIWPPWPYLWNHWINGTYGWCGVMFFTEMVVARYLNNMVPWMDWLLLVKTKIFCALDVFYLLQTVSQQRILNYQPPRPIFKLGPACRCVDELPCYNFLDMHAQTSNVSCYWQIDPKWGWTYIFLMKSKMGMFLNILPLPFQSTIDYKN